MSEQPEDGQVSETTHLRAGADDEGLQQTEGVPPGEDAAQEDQSSQEARIAPEECDVEESVEHSVGEDTE